jgi:MFS family permease
MFLYWALKPRQPVHLSRSCSESSSSSDDEAEVHNGKASRGFMPVLTDGLLAIKNPRILLGYMAGFLARGDTVVLSVFIPLWVYAHYISTGKCVESNTDVKTACHEAYVAASILSGVAQTVALFGAPFAGYLSDRVYRPFTVFLSTIIGGIGILCSKITRRLRLFLAVYDQRSDVLFVIFSCWYGLIQLTLGLVGLGEIGNVVCSLSLVTGARVPKASRGSVAGVYSAFGAVGILFHSKLGGYLFDSWDSGAPFFLMYSYCLTLQGYLACRRNCSFLLCIFL